MITNRYLSAARKRTMQQIGKRFFPGHYLTAGTRHEHGMSPEGSIDDVNGRQLVDDNPNWRGYNNRYYWSYLEPEEGVYDFSKILEDLDRTAADGKVMIVSIEERTFDSNQNTPLPSYLSEDPIYQGGWYTTSTGIFPKFWIPSIGNRMVALLQAMGEAINTNPTLAAVTFQETAVHDIQIQPGYLPAEYLIYLKKVHSAAHAAFPNTVISQTANWRAGMSAEQADEMMNHLVYECQGGFGSTDIIEQRIDDPYPRTALVNSFGAYYSSLRGIAPIITRVEAPTFNTQTARIQYDFVINEMGANIISWLPKLDLSGDPAFTINEVIAVIDAENGRINTTTPSNLLT